MRSCFFEYNYMPSIQLIDLVKLLYNSTFAAHWLVLQFQKPSTLFLRSCFVSRRIAALWVQIGIDLRLFQYVTFPRSKLTTDIKRLKAHAS